MKTIMRRVMPVASRLRAFACAAGGAALVLTTSASAQSASDWDALVAAAKREGSVVFYNGTSFPIPRLIAKAFEQKYGIRVDIVEGRPSEIRERVRTEQSVGRFIGDLRLSGVTTGALEAAEGKYIPHGDLPNGKKVKSELGGDGTMLPVAVGRYAVMLNTNLVKPADEPQTWQDFLDPKWKGKIIAVDPRVGGNGQVTQIALYDKFGRSFTEKFAAQNPTLVRDPPVSQRRLAQGEFSILLPFNASEFGQLQGLPVKAMVPKEGAPYVVNMLAMLKNAPHPNAARLFMDFYISDEMQLLSSAEGSEASTGLISDKLPAGQRKLLEAPLLGSADPFKIEGMLKIFEEIYSKP